MIVKSIAEVDRIKGGVVTWKKISDRLFGIGKFGVGLDGLLTLIPAVGGIYGLGVGGYLLTQAVRVKASKTTLAKMAAMLGADTLLGEVPVVGDAFDFFYRAHAKAANLLHEEIEATHYVEDSHADAHAAGRLEKHHAERKRLGKKRLVFLGRNDEGLRNVTP